MRMLRIGTIAADQVIKRHPIGGNAGTLQVPAGQRGLHLAVAGRQVHARVFALNVEQDHRHAGGLGLLHQPCDGVRFAAAGGAEDCGVPREDVLAVRRNAEDHVLVPDHDAEAQIAFRLEHLRRLAIVERDHRTIGQRSQPRRPQGTIRQAPGRAT